MACSCRLRYDDDVSYCFDVVVERDPDGLYVASVPALRGCHTQASSLDALMERIRESIELCLEVDGHAESAQLESVGVQRVTVPE